MDEQKRTRRWATLAISTAVFYVVSFGPLYYALTAIGPMPPSFRRTVISGIATLYAPHFWLRDRLESYYGYAAWWAELARPEVIVPPWDGSRDPPGRLP